MAADFAVINTNNQGPGSLYQAIADANAAAGRDRIVFNIPGPGVHVIDVSNGGLPEVKDPLIIDGYTQPGARPNTLAVGDDAIILIQIDDAQQKPSAGLLVSAGTSIVRGLSITGFSIYGIRLIGPGTANIIEGNYIGLAPDGITATDSNIGLDLGTSGNMVGGTTPAARNVVAGLNGGLGISVRRELNTISGNYVGTNAAGTHALSLSNGIQAESNDIVIGGTTPGAGNLISGTFAGIQLGHARTAFGNVFEAPAHRVEVTGNHIGLKSDGQTPLDNNNTGVFVMVGSGNLIGGLATGAANTIAFNGGAGVSIWPFAPKPSVNNSILSNSISGRGLGININDNRPNDPMDRDEGANRWQNFPIVTSTSLSGNMMSIQGTLYSAPNTQFTIQLFAAENRSLRQRRTLLTTTIAATDSSGNASFSATASRPSGNVLIDATATDPAGNTSEFFLRRSRFRNLSTRARVRSGEEVLIGGFIYPGSLASGSEIIVRAIGPSLSVGGVPIDGRLADPTLELFANGRLIRSNDNWREDPAVAAEIEKRGLAPTNDLESAAVIYPDAANYTAVVRGKNDTSGIALVEFYDVSGATLHPMNVSTRGLVQAGDNVMIGGVIIADGNGDTPIVFRGIGPTLVSSGVANPLTDPLLEVHDSNGATLATNDDWRESQEAELIATGLAPTSSAESAILAYLPPGSYTAIVRGKGDSTGLALGLVNK